VTAKYDADPSRVHVTGASSGAGTAVILGATYPDVFATVTSVAGGEYGLDHVDPDAPDATPPSHTARQAWSAMGDRPRRVPLLVIQGDADDVVPPLVATLLVAQWTAVHDLVDDGLLNDSMALVEGITAVSSDDEGHSYTHAAFTARDGSCVVESYLVHGIGHAWPGPVGRGLFADAAGPDASAIAWEFAQRHPRASGA
jgi:poly(3-hydroxybutyrate) depolymerase